SIIYITRSLYPSLYYFSLCPFFFSSRRRHTRSKRDWSSDVCSSDLGVLHRLDLAETIRMVPGDVVGVRGDAVPGEAAVDLGAACFGVVGTLQDDRPGALTEHETVAIGIKGPGRRTRCIVTRGNGACPGDSRERDGVDACFGTTRDDNVRTV